MGLTNDGIENEQNPFNPLPPAEFLYNGKYSSGKVLLIPLPLISSTLYLNLNLSIINTHPQMFHVSFSQIVQLQMKKLVWSKIPPWLEIFFRMSPLK